jgi:hypothetical protein
MPEFYDHVPKDLAANLRYRIEIRERAERDVGFRRAIMAACKVDVLYFLNVMVWLYEPRPRFINGVQLPYTIPFITWPHQDPCILKLRKLLGVSEAVLEKSRGEGASWIACMLALHDWLFVPQSKIGCVSSTERKCDDPEDPDSLFWKLDWELTMLPRWMGGIKDVHYKRLVDKHSLTNLRNGSRINGYASTSDVATGGRSAWFFLDELAKFERPKDEEAMVSVQAVTNSRLVISTPYGPEGAYYEAVHGDSNMEKIVLSWQQNPTRNRGLYEFKSGRPVAVDPRDNPLPDNYHEDNRDMFARLVRNGFDLKAGVRSPWYDNECDRALATPKSIAQEYDRSYGGSQYRCFKSAFFNKANATTRAPRIRGEISVDREDLTLKFTEAPDGPVHLWCPLDIRNDPPTQSYTVGADICTGASGPFISNSVVTVINTNTMEQVLEYATRSTEPTDFANVCIAICKWFNDAYLAWERNGPGKEFTERVKEAAYPRLYRQLTQDQKGRQKTKKIGWWTDKKTKRVALSDLNDWVKLGKLQLRSDPLVRECAMYQLVGDVIEHSGVMKSKDETVAGGGHGDRVIAMAVALQGAKDFPVMNTGQETAGEIPKKLVGNCLAWREKLHRDMAGRKSSWDDRTVADLMRTG